MLLFVEHTSDQPASYRGNRTALVDTESIDSNIELDNYFQTGNAPNSESSMISIEYNSKSWFGLKEGSWYDVQTTLFNNYEYSPIDQNESGGLFTRAKLTPGRLGSPVDFTQFLAPKNIAPIAPSLYPDIKNPNSPDLELFVVDCGQGNWNEIGSKDNRIIYDVGASRQYPQSVVTSLVSRRALSSESRDIHIIISHWDVDHYQALLAFSPLDFKSVKSITCPSQIPNTTTYKRVAKLLSINGITLSSVSPAARLPANGRRIMLSLEYTIGPYQFYRATPGRSRNQTGIVMCIEGNSKVAILTGDHHYEKLLAAIAGRFVGKDCILVTPHHGGHAGTIDTSSWSANFGIMQTPISVGNNPFGHPFSYVTNSLTSLQNGHVPSETQSIGDIRYPL